MLNKNNFTNFVTKNKFLNRNIIIIMNIMKKNIYFCVAIFLFLWGNSLLAQTQGDIYTGNIRVTTQAQVYTLDDPGMPLYGNVHKIVGSVEIIEAWGTNDPITDISVFSNLDTITGNIIVKKLTVLNALSKEDPENPNHYIGLSALKHIGACFVIQSNQSLETLGIFNQLQSITTSLDVLFNPSLEKLGEFNHLQSIGVGFTVYSNSSLKKLGNFNALQSLKGYFFVSYNDVLTSLGNFDQLQSVFSLDFSHNSSLKNLEELNSLQYINYHFYVYHNGLTTLGNFNQLQTIGKDFRVYNEDSLTTLGNFNQLQTIGGSFKIAYNNALNNLGDFSELDSIIGDFGVYNNSALLSIDVFPNLTSIGTNDLVFVPSAYYYKNNVSILVENNANLSLCSTLDKFLVGGTHAVEGDVYINNNAADPECTNYQPINVVYTGNIRVTTQTEVDALDDQGMPLYGNIHKIVGSVEIIEASETNDPITDISVFSHVDTITGNVFVQNLTALDALSKENPENPNNYIGLGALKHIGECFLVRDNHFLKKLGIFNDLQTINTSFDVLHNADLKSLGDFNQLQEISGDFEIYNNHSLTTLGNFNQLQSIGKIFGIIDNLSLETLGDFTNLETIGENFFVYTNSTLTTLGNFNNLQSIGGYFSVWYNVKIEKLGDFSNLQSIGGSFDIYQSHSLTTLGDFNNLQSIEYFYVNYNVSLTTLGNFNNLQSIGEYFYVNRNVSLTTLGNFNNLQSIGEYFYVSRNDSLTTLGNFNNLQSIGKDFEIVNNDALLSLGNFPTLTSIGIDSSVYIPSLDERRDAVSILVEDNAKLSACSWLNNFLDGGTYAAEGEIYINNNADGCNSNDIAPPVKVYTGDIRVTTQAQVDALDDQGMPLYGNIHKIVGNVEIIEASETNDPITDISVFSHVDTITGNIFVQNLTALDALSKENPENPNNYIGLGALKHIGECFLVRDNHFLKKLGIFNDLQTINTSFDVLHNADLKSLGDFNQLQEISGDFKIYNNHSLTTLGNFNQLQEIGEDFRIYSNRTINTLGNFNQLQSIGKIFRIIYNRSLETLGDFTNLETIGENFFVYTNSTLTTLGNFNNLQSIGGYFSVWKNFKIEKLGDFNNLQSIGSNLQIYANHSLTTLGDFNNLQSIGEYFYVYRNDSLTTLGNFNNLQSIGEDFEIVNNDALLSLGNFPTLTSIGIDSNIYIPSLDERRDAVSILVENNAELSACSWLNNFLDGGTYAVEGGIYINNNADGCNSNDIAPPVKVYTGDIRITTQAEVDALDDQGMPLYGNIHKIVGNVEIIEASETNDPITDISVFSHVDTITGNVLVQNLTALDALSKENPENPNNYTGLGTLKHIGECFVIQSNQSLKTLGNFNRLQSITTSFDVISNSSLENLGEFSHLQEINGDFKIYDNIKINTLGNFNQLQSIGQVFRIIYNESLKTLGDFTNLETIGQHFFVYTNSTLTTLGNFNNLQSIGEFFNVSKNFKIEKLGDFNNLQSIENKFQVYENHSLTTLGNFNNLQSIGEDFILYRNHSLITLGDFDNLQSIGEDFSVNRNDSLTTLGNFNHLQSIGGIFRILNNRTLLSLGNFPTLTSIGIDSNVYVHSLNARRNTVSILVENNAELSACSWLNNFLDGGTYAVEGEIYINNNADGCNSNDIVPPVKVYTGDIRITTQAEVDALDDPGMPLYGNVHKIVGSLEIIEAWGTNDPITDISVFSHVDTIMGNVFVQKLTALDALSKENPENPNNYIGLGALKHIGECFFIRNNQSLETLGNFNRLQSVTTSFDVISNPSLENIGEFNHLQSIGGNFAIYNNLALKNLNNFNALRSVIGFFFVSNNSALETLESFNALQSIGNLDFSFNPSLKSLGEFNSLQYIQDVFVVYGNDVLTTLGNFNQLQVIGSFFDVFYNDSLTTLGNFNQLQSIGDYFKISYNHALKNLGNFSGLQSIGRDFGVSHNNSLLSLDSFPNLTSIGARDQVFVPSANYYKNNVSIVVESNPNLSLCSTLEKFLEDGTYAVEGEIYINNNADGCNSNNITQPINPVYTGDIRVRTQTEVDALDDREMPLYGNVHKIVGSVEIIEAQGTNDPITDISIFSNLDTITGNVVVKYLTTLDALNKENEDTVNTGLSALKYIGGCFLIKSNSLLETLGNFNQLQSVTTSFDIYSNPSLNNLGEFNNLQSIQGNLNVFTNQSLTTLEGFNQLQSIGGHFDIYANNRLTTLGSFDQLQSIGKYFYVSHSNLLTTLGDFPNLTSIGTSSLLFVPSTGYYINNVSIVVENNPNLAICSMLEKFLEDGTHAVEGEIYINNNADGCNSNDITPQPINPVYTGDIRVTTQTEVDALDDEGMPLYRNVHKIVGNVEIIEAQGTNDPITDISVFSNLDTITGNVSVKNLTALDALSKEHLVNIIADHYAGLSALKHIGGYFEVYNNPSLKTLGNFNALHSIGNNFWLRNNDSLENLGYFYNLRSITKNLHIYNNDLLNRVDAFRQLNFIGGNFKLDHNDVLESLDFPALQSIGETFFFYNNNSLENLGNFSALQSIGGHLFIIYNELLLSLSLPNLTSIGITSDALDAYVPSLNLYKSSASIIVEKNPALSLCSTLEKFLDGGTHAVEGEIYINNNAANPECNNNQPINPVYMGNIIVRTQTEVDVLDDEGMALYNKNIHKIVGSVNILEIWGTNDPITDISVFSNIDTITGNIIVQNLTALDTLSKEDTENPGHYIGLGALKHVGELFILEHNTSLETLGNFNQLQSIGKYFSVLDNDALLSIDVFPNLTSIGTGESWVPSQNQVIINTSIVVEDNANLAVCSMLEKFLDGGMYAVEGEVHINDNAAGCYGNENPQPTNPVYRGNIIVRTQTEVDALDDEGMPLYGNVHKIVGSVEIIEARGTNDPITDISIFSNIDTITGNITVQNLTALDALSKENPENPNNYIGFSALKYIGELFFVYGNTSLKTLGIFNHLQDIERFWGFDNDELTTLGNFNALQSSEKIFWVKSNDKLTTLGNFPVLQSMKHFLVDSNANLTTLGNFPTLQSIEKVFLVRSNDKLTTLGNFPTLQSVGAFSVNHNDALETLSLSALQSIGGYFRVYNNDPQSIGGYFRVYNNDALETLSLSALQSIGGDFSVYENEQLITLGDFSALMSIGTNDYVFVPSAYNYENNVSIVIEHNANLAVCSMLEKFLNGGMYAVEGEVHINDNAAGCNNNQPTNPVYTGNIIVRTQTEVDALDDEGMPLHDGNIHKVVGSVNILEAQGTNDPITDISVFSNIDTITGSIIVQNLTALDALSKENPENPNNYIGLGALKRVGELFILEYNTSLETLGNFDQLQSIGKYFSVLDNDALLSIDVFPNLTSIGTGESWVPSQNQVITNTSIVVEDNDSLAVCSMLEKFLDGGMYAVEGEVHINDNADGCYGNENPQPINPVYTGNIIVRTQTEVDALDDEGMPLHDGNIHKVVGSVNILESQGTNDPITDISVFSNIDTITGSIIVQNLTALDALSKEDTENPSHYIGLGALKYIGELFILEHNTSLETLGNFDQLQSIGKYFSVLDNDSLLSIDVFPNLTNIGTGEPWVPSQNQVITNTSIVVEDNDNLSTCCLLTNFFDESTYSVTGEIYINNNAEGCENKSNIISTCETAITQRSKDILSNNGTQQVFTLYPNPTSGILTIQGDGHLLKVFIHNLVGNEVAVYEITDNKKAIDISHLPSGVYMVTLQNDKKQITEILFKN